MASDVCLAPAEHAARLTTNPGDARRETDLGEDVSCTVCGRMMLPTTGGYFCPSCNNRSDDSIFEGGSATPPMGTPIQHPDEETLFDSSLRPSSLATRRDGGLPPVGASIFDTGSGFDAGPSLESESDTPLPASRPSPASFIDLPEEAPDLQFAEDDNEGQGAFGETVVIPGKNLLPLDEADDEEVSSVVPEHKEALFLPRCGGCNEVLELEEIADGACDKCKDLGQAPVGRREGKRRSASGPPAGILATASGALAALAATWVGVLVVVRAVQSNPDTWSGSQILMESWRIGLVLFALTVSILWATGKSWAGGAALGLGGLAAALAAIVVTSGELLGNIHAASAWMLAGASGAFAAAAAMVPRREAIVSSSRLGGRISRRKQPRDTSELMATSSRGSRKRGSGVNRLRAVLGGIMALALAGVAGWQAALAFKATPGALKTFGPAALRIYGLGTVALFMGFVAIWLFFSPPRGKTSVFALVAAVVVVPLPVWLAIGPPLATSAGLRLVDASGWRAIPAGLGRVLGVNYLADLAPATVAPELKIAIAVALGIGLLASMFALFSRSAARGRGLAGLALAAVLVWGAGFSTTLVPPKPSRPADASSATSAPPEEADPSEEGDSLF